MESGLGPTPLPALADELRESRGLRTSRVYRPLRNVLATRAAVTTPHLRSRRGRDLRSAGSGSGVESLLEYAAGGVAVDLGVDEQRGLDVSRELHDAGVDLA